ncbi:helix-turn-helix domain-containing protein [Desulfomonile tiedjei]|uniref:Helix-turn-helix domain-containing protein n=1 Tax=Desulfomonile tiedjei (strain ATCC 49306 / DSM 6799 / DCB-1) TaxID=706587 RepID=I4C1A6_DESTA|nr:helix-turn-helix domain-containing protein [Desulfomonile tiedjei]AFM23347.1 hypothetical protein Desti_0620 [Desulfomonile tiedjei DSM 6799]
MVENWSPHGDPQPEAAMLQLMDVKDIAKILKIAPKTVHKLVREGKLGCVQVTDKDRRFTREQVQTHIASQSVYVPSNKKPQNAI